MKTKKGEALNAQPDNSQDFHTTRLTILNRDRFSDTYPKPSLPVRFH